MSRVQAGPPERLRGSRVRGILGSRADELIRQRARVRKSAGVEAIHDLRVAARRLQEALSFLEAWLEPEARQRLHRRARRIRRSLGALRNADVMVRLVRDLSRELPTAERGNLRELTRRLRAQSSALRRAATGHARIP